MQRLYSMFPGGAPGCGLMVLRLMVAVSVYVDGSCQFAMPSRAIPIVAVFGLSFLLALGLLTPVAAVVCAVTRLMQAVASAAGVGATLFSLLLLVVVMLLGPGAYSIDAMLFGRRLVVPRPARSDTSENNRRAQ
jgi:uncharacterized membrane protein YphA (DoxX/SURF4 family)